MLTEAELVALIGSQAMAGLRAVAGFPIEFNSIRLRRCRAAGQCINFHTDHALKTMQVALNSKEDYDGGALVFANGSGLHVAPRPVGSATIHAADILHGVTEMHSGVRCGLFFLVEPLGRAEAP